MACFMVYVLFGTIVFSAIELPWEIKMREELEAMKFRFLRRHGCLVEVELDAFLRTVLDASNYGVSALRNVSDDQNWDLPSSLFFVSTVLTTTGYGHSVPFTSGGKAFCMLYSVLGIPITFLLLTSLVQRLMFYVHRVPINYIHTQWGLSLPLVAWIHALVIGSIVVSCFFLIPAIAIMAMENDWDYLQSLYFCFISLSTIGLGNYVPGKSSRHPNLQHLYKVGIACYMVIGLVGLLIVLETFYELQELQHFVKLIMGHPDKESHLYLTEQEVAITAPKLDAGGSLENDEKGASNPEEASPCTTAEISPEK
ncbi:potassium channel subfamily K member 1-like [Carcharodon carcharias]|uniref:potassium channel subfamily K member 1-like n=1 Tax=Carcharodon carcharias TaxID=13397 RepID=UPI001B7DF6EB|nr:potassium channel subfamily K member 1-like [Carcharodon carcharias]